MNQLIAMNAEITMGTREIAEMLGKNHSDIKRSADRLCAAGILTQPMAEREFKTERGNTYTEYRLNKRDCLILVAQNCPEFTAAIVDRWQELEAMTKPQIPQTYAAALLEAGRLAAELEQKHELVLSKGVPQTLTQLVGRAAVRGANSWLLENGYVTTSVDNGWRVWFLTEKGKEFGVQTKERNLRWAVELLDILPPQHELLERY